MVKMEKKVCKCGHSDIIHEYYTDTCHAKGCSCLSFQEPNSNPPSPEHPEKVREMSHEIAEIIKPAYKANGEKYADVAINASCLLLADAIILKLQQAGWGNISKQNQMIITLQERIDTVQAEARQQAYKTILDDIEKHCTEYQWTETPDYTKRHYPFCPTDLYELKVKYLGELPKE